MTLTEMVKSLTEKSPPEVVFEERRCRACHGHFHDGDAVLVEEGEITLHATCLAASMLTDKKALQSLRLA